jgi:hypothetical protein
VDGSHGVHVHDAGGGPLHQQLAQDVGRNALPRSIEQVPHYGICALVSHG